MVNIIDWLFSGLFSVEKSALIKALDLISKYVSLLFRYICEGCREAKQLGKRKENRYNARNLPQTTLSAHIEKRVNDYIASTSVASEAGYVTIRIVSSVDKVVDVKPAMRNRYESDEFPDNFPYRARAMFAFQEQDGTDVCFFGMHTQEFGSDCPQPNANRIYLSYLDSVFFFRPCSLRQSVYHQILMGYFEFCKNRG